MSRSTAQVKIQKKSLEDLVNANKKLNDTYDKRLARENAIRAGDARALAAINAGEGGGTGAMGVISKGGMAARPTTGHSGDKGNIEVNVYVGGRKFNDHIETVVSNALTGSQVRGRQ